MPDHNLLHKTKVCFLQPVLAHYRESFFNELKNNKQFDFRFIAGENYLDIKQTNQIEYTALKHFRFSLSGHKFYYLRGLIRHLFKEKPEIIISGGIDFHLIHTVVAFILFRLILRRKFIWWTHASAGNQGKMGMALRMFFLKRANGVLTYSKKGMKLLVTHGMPSEKVVTLGNSINKINYGYLNQPLNRLSDNDIFTIIFSGRINKERRLDILIEALSRIRTNTEINFNCFIIGNGDTIELKALVEKLGLNERIKFTGPLYDDDIAKLLQKADLMIYPKAIGLSLLHAHSFGIPVITTGNLDLQMPEIELLEPGITGDFYEDESIEDLARMIQIWYENIKTKKTEISDQCIARIEKLNYLPDRMAQTMVNFISKTCL